MLFPSGTYFKHYAYLHNVSAKPLHVSLSLVSPGEGETPLTHSLGQVILQPGQVSQLDFESQFGSSNPLPNGYGHLTATFQGHDGDLMMSTGSVDQSQNYVFEVTPSQQSDTASRTLCFWSVEGDNDSMITVWNYKPTAQDLILTLYYSGGHYKIPIHLAARQSYNLDMMSLVRSRTPDPDGTLIPSNITSGSGILTGPGGETDKISVALAASVFNVRNATCGESCTTCNGATEFALDPGSYTVAVAGTRAAQVQVTWNTGSVYTNPSGTNWATASSAIATVSSSGTLLGVAPGQTGVTANVEDYSMYSMNCSGDEQGGCPTGSPACGGPANVLPLLESSTPLWFFGPGNNPGASFTLGSTQSVITAVRASGGTFAWSIPDGSDELSFTSGSENYSTTTTSNTVTVYSIGYSVDANDVTIQLSWTPSGSSTAIGPISLDLTIDSPYELVSTGATTNRGVGTSCSTGSPNGTAGYQSLVPYQIVSFTGVVISNIGVNETFEDYTDDYIGNTWPTYVAGSTTSSTGTFADNICAIHPAPSIPISLPPHSPLSTVKIDHASQSWLIGSLTVGSGVEVQTNTLQRYQDHGVHNAITSPVR
jgi:hypothetical protein